MTDENARKLSRKRKRVLANIVDKHGRAGLRRLVLGLQQGESGQVIGDALGVSRERVRQWKDTLGTEIRTYLLSAELAGALADSVESADAEGDPVE